MEKNNIVGTYLMHGHSPDGEHLQGTLWYN